MFPPRHPRNPLPWRALSTGRPFEPTRRRPNRRARSPISVQPMGVLPPPSHISAGYRRVPQAPARLPSRPTVPEMGSVPSFFCSARETHATNPSDYGAWPPQVPASSPLTSFSAPGPRSAHQTSRTVALNLVKRVVPASPLPFSHLFIAPCNPSLPKLACIGPRAVHGPDRRGRLPPSTRFGVALRKGWRTFMLVRSLSGGFDGDEERDPGFRYTETTRAPQGGAPN